ncbi:DUF551 domain-containing protein [Raoultella ornithinolytica]|nr:DUF551 domain-containing protein [Raoultella ornithinolytica]MDC7940754.1 DUF551 domain-containing protein [Raoultella ornithinolytica]MDV0588641.1 DUF551 domain-containing protein [Raoultella ornithinolytica]
MTSKLTRLTDDELTETLRLATSGYPLPASVEGNLRHAFAELQERRKTEKDSEPVAWTDEEELRDANAGACGYLFGIGCAANKFADPRRQIMLYRHAQPGPVVPDDTKLRELFDSWFASDCSFDLSPEASEADNIAWRESYWYVWKRCRAAILAAARQSPGSEPATVPGKWIAVSERMPDDDDFVYIWPRPDFGVELHVGQYCECSPKGDGWYAQVYEQNYGIEWYPITVTHWMPLPADPQEVNHG